MFRSIAMAVLFISILGCTSGCTKTVPEPKFENKNDEWVMLQEDPEHPVAMALHNTRTKATVVINFLSPENTISDTAETMYVDMTKAGAKPDAAVFANNEEAATITFTHHSDNVPIRGVYTVKRLEKGKPLVTFFGFWPEQFHEEMLLDYYGIVAEISKKLKSAK